MTLTGQIILALYFVTVGVLSVYGFHRYILIYLYYKNKGDMPRPDDTFDELPMVTVQLPVYNEKNVIERLIEKTCQLNYPKDRLEIQVLDDSTDECKTLAEKKVSEMRAQGYNITFIHREDREGYKAGALDNGLDVAEGEFVCVFDADFLPPSDFLQKTVHFFTNENIGMVQLRWDHINSAFSVLTRIQSILLDGHFVVEHTARHRSNRFFNFNGTAGIWRRTAIEDAGGWEHDTLTEDLDLSYRAQLNDWDFVYLQEQVTPSEVPVGMADFKSQQHRWAKGSIQVANKLLPRIWSSSISLWKKIEATFHLTANVAMLFMLFLSLLMLPAVLVRGQFHFFDTSLLDLVVFVFASLSVFSFYIVSQIEAYGDWAKRIVYLPFLISVGIGLCINNSRAVLEALFGHESPFVRTPKYGVKNQDDDVTTSVKMGSSQFVKRVCLGLEILMAVYLTVAVYFAYQYGMYHSIPFIALFPAGYYYVAGMELYQILSSKPVAMEENDGDPSSPAIEGGEAYFPDTDDPELSPAPAAADEVSDL